jgi:MINDY deubiquitinase
VTLVAGWLLDTNNPAKMGHGTSQEYRANLEQNLSDAVARIPKLTTGTVLLRCAFAPCQHNHQYTCRSRPCIVIISLPCPGIDLNPRFHDCRAYEFTDEVAIFDLLQVPLLHGWLVDPQVSIMLKSKDPAADSGACNSTSCGTCTAHRMSHMLTHVCRMRRQSRSSAAHPTTSCCRGSSPCWATARPQLPPRCLPQLLPAWHRRHALLHLRPLHVQRMPAQLLLRPYSPARSVYTCRLVSATGP